MLFRGSLQCLTGRAGLRRSGNWQQSDQ
jgi:hypothetical protein